MTKNAIKEKLKNGEPVIGTFVRMSSISMEILGLTGWDFAIIDAEHGVHTMKDISNMIRAAKSVGLSPIVRVPGTNPVNAMRCLDAGAEGVQIPQLTSLLDENACGYALFAACVGNLVQQSHHLGMLHLARYAQGLGHIIGAAEHHIYAGNFQDFVDVLRRPGVFQLAGAGLHLPDLLN